VPVQVRLVLHDVSASADNTYLVTARPSLRAARPIHVVPDSTRRGLTADAEVPTDRCHELPAPERARNFGQVASVIKPADPDVADEWYRTRYSDRVCEPCRVPRRPCVIAHVAIALDGATTGFESRVGPFYELAATWSEDVTLVGADTILAQERTLAAAGGPGPASSGPLLAVVDSRNRVRQWPALRDAGHWSDVIALRGDNSAAVADRWPRQLVCGAERVDLARALDELARIGARTVRVDSGGALLGALLELGLLDELSLLVHPIIVGAGAQRWTGKKVLTTTKLELLSSDIVDSDLVWLRYRHHHDDAVLDH
jgi:2,5-diamino-6-(ribosylamino)-4(3H)-pyrimidinone 5'-phosphate reductase